MHAFQIPIKSEKHEYSINTRFIYNQNNKKNPVFLLHGHDKSCTWVSWLRLAFQLYQDGRNILLIDLPGFGQSYVDGCKNSFTIKYKYDSHFMIEKIIDLFCMKNVHAVGWCGGGANFYRAISQHPEKFSKRHVFYNVVISQIPDNFEQVLVKNDMKIWTSWMFDSGEHSKYAMGYKWLKQKKDQKHKNIDLNVIKGEELGCSLLWSKKMGKKTDDVLMLEPSLGFSNYVLDFINGKTCNSYKKIIAYSQNQDLLQQQLSQQQLLEQVIQQSIQEQKIQIQQQNQQILNEEQQLEQILKLSIEQQ